MTSKYKSPGVYMEEIDRGMKPIEAVSTAVAAFIGYSSKAGKDDDGSLLGSPTLVTNWTQYQEHFGGFVEGAYLPDAVYGYFANGGGRCYIVSLRTIKKSVDGKLAASAASAAITGPDGAALLSFSAKEAGAKGNAISVEIKDVKPGVVSTEDPAKSTPTTFTLVVGLENRPPETYEGVSLNRGPSFVETQVNVRSRLVSVKVAATAKAEIVPAAGVFQFAGGQDEGDAAKVKSIGVGDYEGNADERKGIAGLEPLNDVTMIAVPDLMSSFERGEIDMKGVIAVQDAIVRYCEHIKYCFAILDAPPGMTPQKIKAWRRELPFDSSRAALYYPWIEVADQTGANGRTRAIPPSGYVAGIYARNDDTRGVHKAPANEVVRGALGLVLQVTKGEQDELNPEGVNCIRAFPGRGIRVWGARTLSSDPAWRYINVRRLFNMIEESIERGTQWVVFEPNDANLWARVRRDVSAFLRLVWRSGALFGDTPDKAFYVKCDEELNPREVRDQGLLVVELGLAPVKPAEFVVFRISQWAGPDAEE